MYLKDAERNRRRPNWRLRNWLMLAVIYGITGLLWLRQHRPLALIDPQPTPVVTAAEEEEDKNEDVLAAMERGDLYFNQGNITAAMESYEEAVAANPEYALAYARWGQLLALHGKAEEGLIRSKQAVEFAPENPEILAAHSLVLERNEKYQDAIGFAQQALEIDEGFATGHAVLADAYTGSGRPHRAMESAQRAAELDPRSVWAWRSIGYAREHLGEYAGAIEAYTEAIRMRPLSNLYIRRGWYERYAEDYDSAIASFREATVVDPRNPAGYADLGYTYYILQDYEQAKAQFETGIEKDPTYGRNYALLGLVYYLQRNYEMTIEVLEQAVSYGYTSEQVYYELGLSHAYLDQCDAAIPWLERALELNPDSGPAKSGMELCRGG